MTVEKQPTLEQPKRKRRVVTALIAIFGGLALVIGALWGADVWLRQQVADYVTTKVQEVLKLESDQPVAVNIAGFSVIAQVLTGSLEQVDVAVDNVKIGDLSGDVKLVASGVPTDTTKPIHRVQIEFAVTEKSVQSIAHVLSASTIDHVELVDKEIRFTSELSFFGFPVDVGVGVEPFAANGELGFTPTSVSLNGNRADVSQITETFGSLADSLFTSRSICIASYLPAALSLDSVVVRDDAYLVVTIGADDRIFSDQVLRKPGRCSAPAK